MAFSMQKAWHTELIRYTGPCTDTYKASTPSFSFSENTSVLSSSIILSISYLGLTVVGLDLIISLI